MTSAFPRAAFAALLSVSAACGLAAPAAAQKADYGAVSKAFYWSFQPGMAREQFLLNEATTFRTSARDGLELDQASVDRAAAVAAAGRRATFMMERLARDLDGDGAITRREAEDVAELRSRPPGGMVARGARPANLSEVDRLMSLDADGNGSVDMAELRAAADAAQRRAPADAVRSGARFLALSVDGRPVRAAEMMAAAGRAFDAVDSDGDTIVSAEEFRAFATVAGLASPRLAADAAPAVAEPPPPRRGPEEEAYLVAVYDGVEKTGGVAHGPKGQIFLDRPDRQVTLLICSHEPVRWQVTATPGTRLKEVRLFGAAKTSEVVTGEEKQAATLVGAGVECPYDRKTPAFYRFVRALKGATGFERLSGYAGAYRAVPDGFRFDRAADQEPDLKPGSLRPRDPAGLPAIRFRADLGEGPGLYDLTGRLVEKGVAGSGALSVDVPSRGERYEISNNGLTRSPLGGSGPAKAIPTSLDVPRLSWPSGVAYDGKRGRILLVSFGGEGFLYAYDLASETWSVVSSMKNRDVSGLVYDESSDRLWALDGAFGPGGLVAIGPDGAIERPLRFDRNAVPGLTDLLGERGGRNALRLAAVADGKAALTATSGRPGDAGSYRVYLVDLASGQVELTALRD